MSVCPVCGIEKHDTCHAEYEKRIAALEAENERLKMVMGICSGPCHGPAGEQYIVKVREVVAELATLKGESERLKCCGNCKHSEYDGSYFDCEWRPRGEDEWDELAHPSLTLCCYSPSRWDARP